MFIRKSLLKPLSPSKCYVPDLIEVYVRPMFNTGKFVLMKYVKDAFGLYEMWLLPNGISWRNAEEGVTFKTFGSIRAAKRFVKNNKRKRNWTWMGMKVYE